MFYRRWGRPIGGQEVFELLNRVRTDASEHIAEPGERIDAVEVAGGWLDKSIQPESGTTIYGYDGVGNLASKTDGRGVQAIYSYDELDRIQDKQYPNSSTPAVHYGYDLPADTNGIGRLTSVAASGVSTNFYSYDALGRVAISTQTPAGGQPYSFTYAYNLAGALLSETYPSGRVVKTSYDAVNRVSAMTGTLGGQEKSYMGVFEYIAATGAPGGFFYGNNVAPVYSYNSRLQANAFYATNGNSPDYYLLYSGYDWGMGNNNGTLHGSSEYYGNSVVFGALSQISQSYTYDGVNRLKTVTDSGYTQGFSYDQYGNMTTGGVAWDAASSTAGTLYTNNQAGPGCGTAGSVYDCAGNQVVVNGNTLAYDAENRQVSATSPAALGGGTESYFYDGNGQRVAKSGPGGVTTYVYDAFGQLAVEYGASNGTSPCLTCYLTWDALGSVRLVTGESGQVIARHDYLAFGGEIPASTAGRTTEWGGLKDNIAQKFTGQERDSETGLDYFGARYYGSALGRWTSPDVLNITPDRLFNPGSGLNKYIYGANNPLSLIDVDGRDVVALLEPPHGILPGHFMLFANDPTTGKSGMMSFGPVDSSNSGRFFTALNGPMSSTNTYDLPATADDLRNGFAALTIQTSPDQAQAVLSFIKNISANTPNDLYRVLSTNCTTVCRDAMKAIGVLPPNAGSITPFALWSTLFQKYAKNPTYSTFSSLPYSSPSFSLMNVQNQKGVDYGNPSFGMNTFDFIMLQLRSNCTESWDPSTNTLHGCSH